MPTNESTCARACIFRMFASICLKYKYLIICICWTLTRQCKRVDSGWNRRFTNVNCNRRRQIIKSKRIYNYNRLFLYVVVMVEVVVVVFAPVVVVFVLVRNFPKPNNRICHMLYVFTNLSSSIDSHNLPTFQNYFHCLGNHHRRSICTRQLHGCNKI
jgi:hypothetical protein